MLALYIVFLGLSAAMCGAYGAQLAATQGYAPVFEMRLLTALATAGAYSALQLLYYGLLRALKPTRDSVPLLIESLSFGAAILLAPGLLRADVAWPSPFLERVEPLIFFSVFASVHLFMKLVSFFAVLNGRPSARFGALGWLAAGATCALVSMSAIQLWMQQAEAVRAEAPEVLSPHEVEGVYALARALPEGAVLETVVSSFPGGCITLRWAEDGSRRADENRADALYVTVRMQGDRISKYSTSIDLDKSGWTEHTVPSALVPQGLESLSVTWAGSPEPAWRRVLGIHSIITSDSCAFLSGPFLHVLDEGVEGRNFVLLLVDGLGPTHISAMEGPEKATPAIDRLVFSSVAFPNAYTSAAETGAAAMTVVTGLNPLRHGYLGARRGPLPADVQNLPELFRNAYYVTAAFTEGNGDLGSEDTLRYGHGFERGFEVFDPSHSDASGAGIASNDRADNAAHVSASSTLAKAETWIENHRDRKRFVFIRLRALRAAVEQALDQGEDPRAAFEGALELLDRRLGAFIKYVRDYDTGYNTCIILTSPYAYSFDQRGSKTLVVQGEASWRVPLVLYKPGWDKGVRADLVSLDDLAPSLLEEAAIQASFDMDGVSFLDGPSNLSPITVYGDPLTLSMRAEDWRFTWQTTVAPCTWETRPGSDQVQLVKAGIAGQRDSRDYSSRYSDAAEKYQSFLAAYLESARWSRRNAHEEVQ
jgi:hypothetical protein